MGFDSIYRLFIGLGISLSIGLQMNMAAADDTASKTPDPNPIAPPEKMVPVEVLELGNDPYYSRYAFVADKSKRTLTLWEQNESQLNLVKAFPIDKGRSDGDKFRLGDKRTPEGIYFFEKMHKGPNLNYKEYGSRAFTMNYPNFFDLLEGKTGSGIWLHGIPDSTTMYRGSRGCLVVRDQVIQSLQNFINLSKTPIVVQDSVVYTEHTNWELKRALVRTWLQSWRTSWESKDIDAYMQYYGEKFKSLGMNKEQWRSYKRNLNAKYEFIKVEIQSPVILQHDGEYVVRFLQKYKSNALADFGEKSLYIIQNANGDYEIIGEEWAPVKKEMIAEAI